MGNIASFSANSQSGRFVIGDPCYVLPDDIYYDVWEELYNFQPGTVKVDNSSFAVINTSMDFSAEGVSGSEYAVDSGSFAVIAYELCDSEKMNDNRNLIKVVPGHIATIEHDADNETIYVFIDEQDEPVETIYYGYDDTYDENEDWEQ